MLRTIRRNMARNILIDMEVRKPNRSLSGMWRKVLFSDLKTVAHRASVRGAANRKLMWKRERDWKSGKLVI